MSWAVKQPKTALLFYMCDELDAWPKAAQFAFMELQDSKLPFNESVLRGIVENPAKVLEVQWRVGIMKNLSRNGGHIEFQTQDTVPLSDHGPVGPRTGSSTIKTRVKVKYRDGIDNNYYVRKRLEVHADRPRDKTTILNQIKAITKMDHPNIAKIASSYGQGQVVAFITPYAQANLEEYLDQYAGFSKAPELLGWVKDLASALTYIHESGIAHKSIRPQKILIDVDSSRIFFSAFGVVQPMRQSSQLYSRYSNEPGYIYGAPEAINQRDINNWPLQKWHLADIFSLGCVFLEMTSIAKGHSAEDLRESRSARTHDNSYHVNIQPLFDWINNLKQNPHRREKTAAWSNRILSTTASMLYEDPEKRYLMRRVKAKLSPPKPAKAVRQRRNSIDAAAAFSPSQSIYFNEMASLQSYYTDIDG